MDTMIEKKVIVSRVIGVLVFLVGGGALQVALWKKPGDMHLAALGRHGYLWLIYLLVAMLISEHLLKWMKHGITK
jgi:hypothetical protein